MENEEIQNIDTQETDTAVDNKEKVYTKADIDALQSQIDELLQYKPKDLSDDEKALKDKAKNLWEKQVNLSLKENGLEMFGEFINVGVDDEEALNAQITKLKDIVNSLQLSNSYQPADHKPVDAYSLAKKSKDTKSMISAKLNL